MKKLFYIFIFISSLSFSQTAMSVSNTILIQDSIKENRHELDLNNDGDTTVMDISDSTTTKIGNKNDYTKEEIDKKRKQQLLIRIYLIIGIITAIIYSLLALNNKYKENILIEKKIVIPPHITSLNKLENLQTKKLWQKGELKEYYSKLSLILREYTEYRFNFPALELPTSDIIKNLKQLDSDLLSKLESVLRKADNIKYAKGLSLEEENKENMRNSKEFIQLTKIEKDESFK